MTTPTSTPPIPPVPPSPPSPPGPAGRATRPPRPAAPRPVVLGALLVGVAAAVLVPGGPPGLGVVLLAVLAAAVVVVLRRRTATPATTRWQVVHAAVALLLVAAVAVRDAPWLVRLDLLAALPPAALALVPARTWPGVLAALPRLLGQTPLAGACLVRGVRPLTARGGSLGPVVRGLALAAVLLAVFAPLLASADPGFSAFLDRLPGPEDAGALPGRLAVLVVAAALAATAIGTATAPPPDPVVAPAGRVLRRASEWLLPLGALDALLATFLLVQADDRPGAQGTYADQLHAGFFQLLAVTALVLAVVAAAVRWTTVSRGVRAALGLLCALTLAVDASALSRLHAYTDAYGLTRLRIGVGTTSLALAAVLLVLLVAGALGPSRGRQRWVPHAVVLVGAVAVLVTTGGNPDAAIARSGAARGAEADTAYLSVLSADAVPALLGLGPEQRACVLQRARLQSRDPWTSWNVSRARAARLLASEPVRPALGCPVLWRSCCCGGDAPARGAGPCSRGAAVLSDRAAAPPPRPRRRHHGLLNRALTAVIGLVVKRGPDALRWAGVAAPFLTDATNRERLGAGAWSSLRYGWTACARRSSPPPSVPTTHRRVSGRRPEP